MPMFRKRPVVIEARQLAGAASDVHDVYQWIESHTSGSFDPLAVLGGDVPAPKSGVSIDPANWRNPVTSIVAFRCPGCGLDEVFDMDTEECWTLDGSDYGDEGSTA